MKQLLIGVTLGMVAGAVALKKIENKRIPEKALKAAEEKLKDN